ncbi:hypothetical protein VNO78_15781 [Psophocarpus tetragonolobus]|uniref:Uncharacterized protein n=1 Tax=Psophocarpus tetragonolobus TaxID=3891 RepID=A0AAN9XK81_PSOTE
MDMKLTAAVTIVVGCALWNWDAHRGARGLLGAERVAVEVTRPARVEQPRHGGVAHVAHAPAVALVNKSESARVHGAREGAWARATVLVQVEIARPATVSVANSLFVAAITPEAFVTCVAC